jgi:hypothetical protein
MIDQEVKRKVRKISKEEEEGRKSFWSEVKRVQNQSNNNLRREMDKEMKSIPGTVALELHNQLGSYLHNEPRMQQILNDHKERLVEELERIVRTELERLSHEDTYHQITNSFTDAIKRKGDNVIKWYETENRRALDHQKTSFDTKLKEMKETVDHTNKELKSKIEKIEILENSLKNVKNEFNMFKSDSEFWNNVMIGLSVGVIAMGSYFEYIRRV